VKLQEIDRQLLTVLCIFIRSDFVGGRTTDPDTISHKLPLEMRVGVKGACESLHRLGFLSRKPKPDVTVYSLRTALDSDCLEVVNEIRSRPDIYERLKANRPLVDPPPLELLRQVSAHPDLQSYIERECNDRNGLRLEGVEETDEVDIEGDPDCPNLMCVDLSLSVKCPGCERRFEWKLRIGVLRLYSVNRTECARCGARSTFKGLRRVF
jgi:hypothetical protein